ncbi:hypothetical protein GCM10009114_24730 [Aliiglaciecola litoralis]|uniref:Probable oxaloacetate decarboxylase gamma chain n=2 Tax=Aliiglaciecola litoralis TaxID=582857 RepID=A0ABP3WWS4_9ALTE
MVVGMGVVFVFLTLMIGAVNLIAYLNAKFPEQVTHSYGTPSRSKSTNVNADPAIPVAAITAAVHQYRKNRQSR